jgi:hypothetical protein
MHMRHRTPSIFSIYMVDVMCCALGCVILLWQVNRDESETRNAELQKAQLNISSLDQDRQGLLGKLSQSEDGRIKLEVELKVQLERNQKLAVVLEREKDELRKWRESHDRIVALSKKLEGDLLSQIDKNEKLTVISERDKEELKKLRETHEAALAVINNLQLETKGLKDEVAELKVVKAALEGEKRKTAASLSARSEELAKLLKKLNDAEGKVVLLSKEAADRSVELSEMEKKFRELTNSLSKKDQELVLARLSLDTEKSTLATFLKNLEATNLSLADLRKEKLDLIARVQAAESRFAGMTLTGRKVVFLVDMSGSMELIDLTTADPDKWPTVCDTIARVMDSLNDLDSFQVILFSKTASYPLGEPGRFHKYRSKDQIKNVASVLKTIKPVGGTNMYAAFEEAFKLRAQGLDTIYLFSDGLPNEGEGLPPNAAQLTEQQRTDALSRHIRNRLKTVWNRNDPVKVKINTVGFYYESAEVGAFLWALARENDGSFVGMNRP